jgi:type VI secretion system protein VasD
MKRFQISGLGRLRPLAALAILLGCSHPSSPPPQTPATPPCPPPEPLRISLRAGRHLNPSERGEPLATVVRVYQLKGTGKIGVASFDDLLDHDRDTLAEDLVGVQEVTVNPGVTLDPPLSRSAEASHIAVVGLFRRPTGTSWRAVEKLPPPDPQFCHPAPPSKKGPPPKDPTLRFSLEENHVATIKTP